MTAGVEVGSASSVVQITGVPTGDGVACGVADAIGVLVLVARGV
jgi:hypothetical protein